MASMAAAPESVRVAAAPPPKSAAGSCVTSRSSASATAGVNWLQAALLLKMLKKAGCAG